MQDYYLLRLGLDMLCLQVRSQFVKRSFLISLGELEPQITHTLRRSADQYTKERLYHSKFFVDILPILQYIEYSLRVL